MKGLFHTSRALQFLLFFGMNQCGSALHAYLLGAAGEQHAAVLPVPWLTHIRTDPALAVPLSNAFTFVFTALTSVLLGETPRLGGCKLGIRNALHVPRLTYEFTVTVAGILLVATGAGMCVVAKPQA